MKVIVVSLSLSLPICSCLSFVLSVSISEWSAREKPLISPSIASVVFRFQSRFVKLFQDTSLRYVKQASGLLYGHRPIEMGYNTGATYQSRRVFNTLVDQHTSILNDLHQFANSTGLFMKRRRAQGAAGDTSIFSHLFCKKVPKTFHFTLQVFRLQTVFNLRGLSRCLCLIHTA